MNSVGGNGDLEAIGPDEPTPVPGSARTRDRRLLAGAVAMLLAGGGFVVGQASRDEDRPLPVCGERPLGLIEADGLPDAPVRVAAPLRPTGLGDGPLPLPGSMTVEVVGVAEGDDTFRARDGRLVLAVELPRSSIGKSAQIESRDGATLAVVPISSPLCSVSPAPVETTSNTTRAEAGWEVLPASPLSARYGSLAAWTGEEFLVVGGSVRTGAATEEYSPQGAAYNPATERWRPLPDAPFQLTDKSIAVWTGTELLVVGGAVPTGPGTAEWTSQAAAYAPQRNLWRRLPPAPLRPRWNAFSAWTGTRLLVWGGAAVVPGIEDVSILGDGASYDAAAGSWQPISQSPRPTGARGPSVWTGDRWLLGGGENGTDGGTDHGWVEYDPRTDGWRRLPDPPFPGDLVQQAVIVDDRVLVWPQPGSSGAAYLPATRRWEPVAALPGALGVGEVSRLLVPVDGGVVVVGSELHEPAWRLGMYNAMANTWSDMPGPPVTPRQSAAVSGGGSWLLIWGGFGSGGLSSDGAVRRLP